MYKYRYNTQVNQLVQQFLISILLYLQNIVFSLFNNLDFTPSLWEFLSIFLLVLLISKIKYHKTIFTLWLTLYFIHFSFISFFGAVITTSDIYLFFTHFFETYETFIYTLDIYIVPSLIFIISLIALYKIELKNSSSNPFLILLLIIFTLFHSEKLNDRSFLLIQSLFQISFIDTDLKNMKNEKIETPLRDSDINIVLIIGESMRAKEFQEEEYEMFEHFFYKTIYSGATATDVSLPLLINGATRPSEIDFSKNIFSLATNNNYTTSFISIQTKKSMRYIKPYLHQKKINNFNIVGSRDDKELLNLFENIDFNSTKANFIVMQMQGQHSPYIYYENYKKSTIQEQYTQSMHYSNRIILEMIEYIKSLKKETLFIFTSDHGELLGERGKMGHNRFEKEIYRVPLILFHTLKQKIDFQNIQSHHDIYTLMHYILGYAKELEFSQKKIRVNGSMISEEDGFREF